MWAFRSIALVLDRTPILSILFIGIYTKNWPFAFIYGGAALAHELGHAAAFYCLGLGVSAIRFNLIGAFTDSKRPASRQIQMGISGLAGPASGLVQALITLGLYLVWPSPLLAVLVATIAILNLFNCAPLLFMDGYVVVVALVSRLSKPAQTILTSLPTVLVVLALLWTKHYRLLIALVVTLVVLGIPSIINYLRTATARGRWIKATDPAPLQRRHILALALAYVVTILGLGGVTWYILHAAHFTAHSIL